MKSIDLKAKQAKLDSLGKTIKFVDESKNFKNYTTKKLINFALMEKRQKLTNPYTIGGIVYENAYFKSRVPETRLVKKQKLGRSRSLEDLYLLCKHYNPKITIQEVVSTLKELPVDAFFCYSFGRTMFQKRNRQTGRAREQFKKYV